MENQELHAQKVTILSRLIKENYLTLEEALLLLKEEEPKQAPINFVSGSGTISYPSLGTWSTTTNYPSFISTTGTSFINTAVDNSADLNT
jgi:hypothetical protein